MATQNEAASVGVLFVFVPGLDLLLLLLLLLLLFGRGLRWVTDGFRRIDVAVVLVKQLHLFGKSQPFVCNSLPAGFDG